MKTGVYYLAIGMLVLFVGVIVFKLIFGTPCTNVGNYCVGDGWTIAGLAGTVLAVSATILGILGAFAVAAWWTDLDKRVSKQVDTILKQQEDKINKQIDAILSSSEKKIQEDLTIVTDRIKEVDQQVKNLFENIQLIRQQYEDVKKISIDTALFGRPWMIEVLARSFMDQFHMVEVAERMVYKYLGYIDGFLSQHASEVARHSQFLIQEHAPRTDLPYFWQAALDWKEEVEHFRKENPEVVKRVDERIDSYKKRIDSLKSSTEQ